jgi:plastocyanin
MLALIIGALLLAPHHAYAATHTIIIEGLKFIPDSLTLQKGDTVIWKNQDILSHTATSLAPAFDSKEIKPGKRWQWKARKKGSFSYDCSFHPTMKATLLVQ